MKSLRKTILFGGLLLCAAPATLLKAQAAPQARPDTPQAPESPDKAAQTGGQVRIQIPVNQVIVPVTVKDSAGHLVPDLQRDDFRIFEDDIEQRIEYFSGEAFPLSLVILLDNDLKSKDADQVSASMRAIVAGLSTSDEAQICRFDQFFHPGKGFTKDQDKLLTELKRTTLDAEPSVAAPSAAINAGPTINGHSATSDAPNTTTAMLNIKGQPTKTLDDGVYGSAELLKDRGRERRKIILLISDGVNGAKFNTHSYKSTVEQLLRYGVSVYSVAVSSAYFDRKFSRLVDYAHSSGGDVYFASKPTAMEELYSRIAEQARHQYTLAYSPTGTNRAADYHSIEVRVKRPDLTVKAREGYYTSGVPR
jgi:VWFA-related protein